MCYSSKKNVRNFLKLALQSSVVLVVLMFFVSANATAQWFLPVQSAARASATEIKLTPIGQFGLMRKARKGIPAHLHTGIDIMRRGQNYIDEPVFPASEGIVISVRDDGPFAQIIIEHEDRLLGKLWTVYEHVSGIRCSLGQKVYSQDTIARFFSREELNYYGWQFDHLHFEVMKAPPLTVQRRKELPHFRFTTYALTCYTREQLEERMIDPMRMFK